MKRRQRPQQHIRRLKSGKKTIVNKGVKRGTKNKATRYITSTGKFKKMTVPGRPKGNKSKFGGCARSMIAKGNSQDAAIKICGAIKARRFGSSPSIRRCRPKNKAQATEAYKKGQITDKEFDDIAFKKKKKK